MKNPSESLDIATIMLWMNSGCNARCLTCEIWRERVGTVLSASVIASYLPEWKEGGVKLIELCGEPTIHPEFREICEMLNAANIRFSVLSNGLKLYKFAELIVDTAVSLTVSLDGPHVVHDQVRNVPRSFERLQRGVEAVRNASGSFPIYGRCALHRLNYKCMADTVDTARALGLTNISFFGLDDDSTAFGREHLEPEKWQDRMSSLAFSSDDIPSLNSYVRAISYSHAEDFESGFIAESPELLHRSLSPHQRNNGLEIEYEVRCNAPYKSVVIEPNGEVKPCWFLESYGNLRDHVSMQGVLETAKAIKIRGCAMTPENITCQRCITPRVFGDDGTSESGLSI